MKPCEHSYLNQPTYQGDGFVPRESWRQTNSCRGNHRRRSPSAGNTSILALQQKRTKHFLRSGDLHSSCETEFLPAKLMRSLAISHSLGKDHQLTDLYGSLMISSLPLLTDERGSARCRQVVRD